MTCSVVSHSHSVTGWKDTTLFSKYIIVYKESKNSFCAQLIGTFANAGKQIFLSPLGFSYAQLPLYVVRGNRYVGTFVPETRLNGEVPLKSEKIKSFAHLSHLLLKSCEEWKRQ